MVEIFGYEEPVRAQTKGPRRNRRGLHGPNFRDRTIAAHNEDRFARYNAANETLGIALNVLYAHGAHTGIVNGAAEPSKTMTLNGRVHGGFASKYCSHCRSAMAMCVVS
ncbi:MAG: hypothetical protein WCL32_24980 [Planctomycetota bacterium]